MKSTSFYAVSGTNGLGIFTDYTKALCSNHYLTAFKLKKYKSYLEAKNHAIETYNELQNDWCHIIDDDESVRLPINWVVYKKDIVKTMRR